MITWFLMILGMMFFVELCLTLGESIVQVSPPLPVLHCSFEFFSSWRQLSSYRLLPWPGFPLPLTLPNIIAFSGEIAHVTQPK